MFCLFPFCVCFCFCFQLLYLSGYFFFFSSLCLTAYQLHLSVRQPIHFPVCKPINLSINPISICFYLYVYSQEEFINPTRINMDSTAVTITFFSPFFTIFFSNGYPTEPHSHVSFIKFTSTIQEWNVICVYNERAHFLGAVGGS